MTKCQSNAKSIECSNREANPEMFTVSGKRIECLAHAIASEAKGRTVEVILT